MLRLVGFFVATLIVLQLLRAVPVIGRVFDVPILGFWGAAILVALATSRLADRAVAGATFQRRRRELGRVDTPHNQGKLGALLLAAGRARAAIEPLTRAVAGEPDSIEWRYRLGLARVECGELEAAIEDLSAVARVDDEYAYGDVQLRLAGALLRQRRMDEALAALDVFDRNHGPSPESAYRRGSVYRALGRRAEARAAFARVTELTRNAARFQQKRARSWAFKSLFARWI